MADLARTLGLPALLVVGLKLGCLNQAQLTHRAIVADGAAFAGWVASGVDAAMERSRRRTSPPWSGGSGNRPLAVVPHRAPGAARRSPWRRVPRGWLQRRLSV